MPVPIIAQWLNLPKVEIIGVRTEEHATEIALEPTEGPRVCSCCGKEVSTIYDSRIRRLRDLSVFELATYLVVSRRRVLCPCCGVKVEELKWAEAYQRCTIRFAEYVAKLCEFLPVKQVADLLDLDWKTVKEIDKQALKGRFGQPDYAGLRLLAVDEVSYKKHHKYLTVVLDLERTRVVWVGQDRSKETLDRFFEEIGQERAEKIVAMAIDMWDPFLASIKEHAPQAAIVFDKFHVIASYGRIIDKVRNEEYRKAAEAQKPVLKGTKYLLLKNPENLKPEQKLRLEELLSLNQNLNTAYLLKEELRRFWDLREPQEAQSFLDRWIGWANESGIEELIGFAKTLDRYREGLINHACWPINSAKLEGVNNKIKVIKRMAYGFHDVEYFILKIKQGFP